MKTFVILFIAFLSVSEILAVQTDIQTFTTSEKARKALEKTGWGQLGLAMLEVQMATNGPLDELVMSFMQLMRDLQFKIDMNVQEFALKTQDHNAIEGPILHRISDAESDIAGFNARLGDHLHPYVDQLTGQINNDNTLIQNTLGDKDKETRERDAVKQSFRELYELTQDQRDAVQDAIDLLHGLRNEGAAAFVQVKVNAMKEQLMKVRQLMKKVDQHDPMIKVLLALVQNFTDQSGLERVLSMMEDVLTELTTKLTQMEQDDRDQEAAYQAMQDQYQATLDLCNDRNAENGGLLTDTNLEIDGIETQHIAREADLVEANGELDAETARWAGETQVHEDLLASLNKEMEALESCVAIFSSAELSGGMLDRLDQ